MAGGRAADDLYSWAAPYLVLLSRHENHSVRVAQVICVHLCPISRHSDLLRGAFEAQVSMSGQFCAVSLVPCVAPLRPCVVPLVPCVIALRPCVVPLVPCVVPHYVCS